MTTLGEVLDRDGFAVTDLLDAAAVGALLQAWEELEADVKSMPFSATILSRDPAYRERVHRAVRDALGAPVGALLAGTRIAYGAFVVKRPDELSAVPIHQDLTFVDEDLHLAVNVWVPLIDVDSENGCLRVLRGSHRLNDAPRGTDFRLPHLEHIAPEDFEDVPLRAGQACVMTGPLYHASNANHSGVTRVAAAALVVPAEAQLRYLYAEPGGAAPVTGRELEVFEVEDAFYRHHMLGTRPEGLQPVGIDRRESPSLGREEVLARLAGSA